MDISVRNYKTADIHSVEQTENQPDATKLTEYGYKIYCELSTKIEASATIIYCPGLFDAIIWWQCDVPTFFCFSNQNDEFKQK